MENDQIKLFLLQQADAPLALRTATKLVCTTTTLLSNSK
jgi:hypothetical protein